MADIIILLIVIVLIFVAIKQTKKHMKGESPCCGGGGGDVKVDIPIKNLENPVLGRKTVKISGMTCQNCVKHVTEAINSIDGASAKVDLDRKEAVVSYDRFVENDKIKEVVKKAGYRVDSIL